MRTHSDSSSGTSHSPSCALGPMSSTLSTVPTPGRWRIGIQNSSTTTPMRFVTSPNGIPVTRDTPCESTSHGATPTAARIISASPSP